ncbi:hypothetical protein GO998_22665 (plasmid) [Ralstonia syzygii]|uniref:VCBS repeat-containing protein n=1 Tax=Ralstonia syzygii TaxID=28097 RepID=A0ABX7ZNZ6_9RALS|nr:VCBS repeat-containing protein [Ralstonia syzygii]QUP56489.1 hypothetical protein GO998_22665 [Ralstonia syzygii]
MTNAKFTKLKAGTTRRAIKQTSDAKVSRLASRQQTVTTGAAKPASVVVGGTEPELLKKHASGRTVRNRVIAGSKAGYPTVLKPVEKPAAPRVRRTIPIRATPPLKGRRSLRHPTGVINESLRPVGFLPARPRKDKRIGERVFLENGMLAPAPTYSPLAFNGGPILSGVELVSLYWGNFAQSDIDTMQAYLQGLAGYLSGVGAPANQVPVLWQYNCVCATVGATFTDTTAPQNATDQDVRDKLVSLQNAGSLPPFSDERLFLVFTNGITFPNYGVLTPQGWCGYHNQINPGEYYALIPQPTSGAACFTDDTAGWQSVTSHEVMEAMTDPSVGGGWTDTDNNVADEGGDSCNFQENSLSFGIVQSFDDNSQQTCSIWTPSCPAFWVKPFSPWAGYAIPNGLWLVGDFNGDGRSDIVHAVQDTDYVNVWTSLGDAQFDVTSFRPWSGYAIPNGLWLVGDFNGDGKADIVHVVDGSDYVNVWLSNGDGTFNVNSFSPWSGYAMPNGLWLVGDFNGDGRADIVHVVDGSDYVNVWLSNGDGTFSVSSFSPWSGYAMPNGLWLVGDFNGDGRADIVHVVDGADYVNIWTSNGDGTFSVSSFNPWPGYAMPNGLWMVGDFNGDGRTDIVHAVQDTDYVNVWMSNGDATFTVNSFSPWAGYAIPNGLWLVGDFNGDGRADIVHAVQDTDYVNIWTSNGNGTFEVTPFSPWSGYAIPNGLWLVGEFDGDGRADIVHAVQDTNYANVWTSLYSGYLC